MVTLLALLSLVAPVNAATHRDVINSQTGEKTDTVVTRMGVGIVVMTGGKGPALLITTPDDYAGAWASGGADVSVHFVWRRELEQMGVFKQITVGPILATSGFGGRVGYEIGYSPGGDVLKLSIGGALSAAALNEDRWDAFAEFHGPTVGFGFVDASMQASIEPVLGLGVEKEWDDPRPIFAGRSGVRFRLEYVW